MEWLVLVLFAGVAALLIGLPLWRGQPLVPAARSPGALREERERLLAELRELDEDSASGRISEAERLAGRRSLAPQLRAVTEALRSAGDDVRARA